MRVVLSILPILAAGALYLVLRRGGTLPPWGVVALVAAALVFSAMQDVALYRRSPRG